MSKLGSNSPLAGLLGLGSLAGANPGGGVNPHAGNTADGRWQCWQKPFVGVFVLVLGESCQRVCVLYVWCWMVWVLCIFQRFQVSPSVGEVSRCVSIIICECLGLVRLYSTFLICLMMNF